MRTLAAGLLLALTLHAAAPVPRPAGVLTVLEPSGKQTPLASLKGNVVVVQFLLTTCPHCQAFSKALNKITTEFGPKVKVIGVAFDPADTGNAPTYIKTTGATFPVGSADKLKVLQFLGVSVMDYPRLKVPQVVVIDKKGMIRSQTLLNGAGQAGDEIGIRPLLAALTKE
ncbi:MAG: TlpA disulfide reductase family protein [Acidobacteriota bacterium]